jgi:ribulose-5-phosphate 4-epimerase/fuculose-1-phosphate aldolase
VREHVLEAVGELEGVHVAEAVLHVAVDDQLGEAQDLAAQMERVAETGLLALLWGEEGTSLGTATKLI